jgi:hypothetical protein
MGKTYVHTLIIELWAPLQTQANNLNAAVSNNRMWSNTISILEHVSIQY